MPFLGKSIPAATLSCRHSLNRVSETAYYPETESILFAAGITISRLQQFIHIFFPAETKKEAMFTDTASPKIYLNKEFFIPTRLWQVVLKRCHSILG